MIKLVARGCLRRYVPSPSPRRGILTLAIETSCDDTSVAVLEQKTATSQCILHFHEKVTADNSANRGIHPAVAVNSHQQNLAWLLDHSIKRLPSFGEHAGIHPNDGIPVTIKEGSWQLKRKPDFVSVTRGPGITAALASGLDSAKGIAVAWQIPLVGVNHMQAHALTPRLVSALNQHGQVHVKPEFPYLSLLVSGGHTMAVHSKSLDHHAIMSQSCDIAVGDALDKMAREVLPQELLSGREIMFGRLLERFAFPNGESDYKYAPPRSRSDEIALRNSVWGWALPVPLRLTSRDMRISFSGLETSVRNICHSAAGKMSIAERIDLARECMRVAFEHITIRVIWALQDFKGRAQSVSSLVISGGVASNGFLRHVLRSMLDIKGFGSVEIITPPVDLCTDNAAMIAWTGLEMYRHGWSTDLRCQPLRKWSIDPDSADGGVMGVGHWKRLT